MSSRFSLTSRLKSFKHAIKGLYHVTKHEHNFWLHLIATAVVVTFGFFYEVSISEWLWITLAIGLVLTTEIMNTGIERLVDLVEPEINKKAGLIKDIGAGAVLIASITSAIIGLLIFTPKIF